jgi:ferredoxin
MADHLQKLGKSYEVHYAGRARATMALLDRLERNHAPHLNLHIKTEGQRMQLSEILHRVTQDVRVYACGPDRLIEELENLAESWPQGVLHFEHFNADVTALDPSKEHAFVAHLKDSGVDVKVPADRTLLQALQAAGFDVPCDCNEGLCGTCEVSVIDGEVDHRDKVLSKSERATHKRMLACSSRAVGQKIVLGL